MNLFLKTKYKRSFNTKKYSIKNNLLVFTTVLCSVFSLSAKSEITVDVSGISFNKLAGSTLVFSIDWNAINKSFQTVESKLNKAEKECAITYKKLIEARIEQSNLISEIKDQNNKQNQAALEEIIAANAEKSVDLNCISQLEKYNVPMNNENSFNNTDGIDVIKSLKNKILSETAL